MKKIRIGTRGSQLALCQADTLKNELLLKGFEAEIIIIKTEGDKNLEPVFEKIEGKGIFIKELETALMVGQIDVAIHSLKDVPTEIQSPTLVMTVMKRANPSDVLIMNPTSMDYEMNLLLKKNAVVGTSSNRRKSQLLSLRSDMKIKPLRGNVNTRLRKLKQKEYDAIVLARAGLDRMDIDLSAFYVKEFSLHEFVPSPGQGSLAVQWKKNNTKLSQVLKSLNDQHTEETTQIERQVLNQMGGGCHMPLGVYCEKLGKDFSVQVAFAKSGDDFIRRFTLTSNKVKAIAPTVIKKLHTETLNFNSAFISRKTMPEDFLYKYLKNFGVKLFGEPFIKTQKLVDIPKLNLEEYDVLFFSSPRGVDYFLDAYGEPPKFLEIYSMGVATTKKLEKNKIRVNKLEQDSNPARQGMLLKKIWQDKKVLLPTALKSADTIFNIVKHDCAVRKVPVYETLPVQSINHRKEDVLIFTSPSNVENYFLKHSLLNSQKAIAMGTTTQKKLTEFGIESIIPTHSSDIGIASLFSGI